MVLLKGRKREKEGRKKERKEEDGLLFFLCLKK
jgi:hypothetical protein